MGIRPTGSHENRGEGWKAVAVPALIATIPLIGLSFQLDERRRIYWGAHRFGSDPIEAARFVYRGIDGFLTVGNFRPVGRFVEIAEHSFALEAGEATGLAPHVAHGFMGLFMVVVLAHVAYGVVSALVRSSGGGRDDPVLSLYPLALGVVLVANAVGSSLVLFPVTFIGVVVLIMAVALAVARDRDMQNRPMRWHEPVTMALLGAVAALTYDLVYVAPPLAAAFIAARAIAAGLPARSVLRTAALRRWTAMSIGFLVVFVPVRVEIARRCAEQSCYNGSDLSLSPDAISLAAGRLLTGAPPVGWFHSAQLAREAGLGLGFLDLAANSLLGLLLVTIAAVTAVAAVRSATQTGGADRTSGDGDPAATLADRPPRRLRLALALGTFGAVAAALSALLASLSRVMQELRPPIHVVWRETFLTQVAWSFVIAALVAAVVGTIRTRGAARIGVAATATVLGTFLCLTLLANWRLAETDRREPISSITSLISTATVNIDATEGGNTRRCALIDAYTELAPTALWTSGPEVRQDLDLMMLDRYGWPFCDPTSAADDRP